MNQDQNDSLSTKESVLAFLSQLDQAAGSRDLDRYMKLFSPQPDVLLAYSGQLLQGVEAIAASHQNAWSQLTFLEFHTSLAGMLQAGPDFVVVMATGHSSRTYQSGESYDGTYALTLVLEKHGESWRIRQKHESIRPSSHQPKGGVEASLQ